MMILQNPAEICTANLFDAAAHDLPGLALAINEQHALAEQYATLAIHRAKQAGEMLNVAKQKVAHGQWLPWLKANCPTIKERTARAYMQLARNWERLESKTATVADLTINEALKLLAEPKPEPDPELEPLTHDEQNRFSNLEKTINGLEHELSEVARALQEAKYDWCANHPGLFESWCEHSVKIPADLRDMMLDPARRWHPRYWDDEQAELIFRFTLTAAGCSENEVDDFIRDYCDQRKGDAQ